MRGERIYGKMTENNSPASTPKKKTKRKGRCNELINRRNSKLLHRFYYYSVIHKLNYEAVLMQLNKEFDIKEFTIADIIAKSSNELMELKEENLNVVDLKKMYPLYTWENPKL